MLIIIFSWNLYFKNAYGMLNFTLKNFCQEGKTHICEETWSRMLIFKCSFFTAVTCPSIETLLSEHVVWRLIAGSLNEYGAQVMLSCSPGYYLLGRRLIQCRSNGTWSVGNEKPSCKGKEHTCLQNSLYFLIHIFYFRNSLKFF